MHLIHQKRQAMADLSLAMALGVVLFLLNLSVNLIGPIHRFLSPYGQIRAVDWVINGLFFWLVMLLWLAFARWRAAARRSQELERIVSSISPDALLVLNPDQTIAMCSRSLHRFLGYAPEEVVGWKAGTLYEHWRLGSDGPEEVRRGLTRDGFYLGVASARRKDGRALPVEIIGAELKDGAGAVLLMRDIGERLRAQEERRELERRAEQWQKLEGLATLAGGLAHDFSNVLAVMSANADLALRKLPPDAPARDRLRQVIAAVDHAGRQCDQMMTYSGRRPPEAATLDLSACVVEAGRHLPVPLSKPVRLVYELAGDLPPVLGDSQQIRTVIAALVGRAIEALGAAEGRIVVRTGLVACDAERLQTSHVNDGLPAGPYVCLEVVDTGAAPDAQAIARFFDPFPTGRPEERGLELAYAVGIIRAHRGAVAVRGAPGLGTSVTVYLPTAELCRAATGAPGIAP